MASVSSAAFVTFLLIAVIGTEANQVSRPRSPRATLKLTATLSGHAKNIITESFSPDGKTIATGSEDGTVRLWDAQTGQNSATFRITSRLRELQLAWSPDERKLAVKHSHGGEKIQIWDVQTSRMQATVPSLAGEAVEPMAWSPDSRTLLTSGHHGKAMLWDAETGALRATLVQDPPCPKQSLLKTLSAPRCEQPGPVKARFVADGGVLSLSDNHSPKLWDPEGHLRMALPFKEETSGPPVWNLLNAVLSPDLRLIAHHDGNGVQILEATSGRVRNSLGDIGEPLDFSPDGQRLLVLKRDSKTRQPCFLVRCDLKIFEASSGHLMSTFEKMSGDFARSWSPNGAVIVTVSGTLLDTRNGRVSQLPYEACTPDRMIGSTQCEPLVFSSDGRIALKLKNPLKLWDTDTGQFLSQIDEGLSPAVFSPADDRLIITRGLDKRVALLLRIEL